MIRDRDADQFELFAPEDFETPFGAGLDPRNRWVQWAQQIPWAALAASYHAALKPGGRPAKPARLVLGALIIKHRLGLSDTETIEQLRENPYLQYFCGFERYQHTAAFAPTLFVKLRERLSPDRFAAFEQAIIDQAEHSRRSAPASAIEAPDDAPTSSGQGASPTPSADGSADANSLSAEAAPRGQLIIDASVVEQAIRYPTDVGLLNDARESAETIIDQLWGVLTAEGLTTGHKPRTYRQRARTDSLAHSKKRRMPVRARRAAHRQQLQYMRRDLGHVDRLLDQWHAGRPGAGFPLAYRQQHRLWVIRELARQQDQLHCQRARRIDNRIVSLAQPHVRPIVRGRLGHPVEFGAKFSVALVDGLACVDALRWDAFAEAGDLVAQCQAYRQRYCAYPAKVLADGVYGTRANRRWLKARGIAFGGTPLGPPAPAHGGATQSPRRRAARGHARASRSKASSARARARMAWHVSRRAGPTR